MFARYRKSMCILYISDVDPHRLKCGSGSGILGKCGSRILMTNFFIYFTDEKNPPF
jgi:hypothetical protein